MEPEGRYTSLTPIPRFGVHQGRFPSAAEQCFAYSCGKLYRSSLECHVIPKQYDDGTVQSHGPERLDP